MNVRVFIDAFSEVLVSVAMARKYPAILTSMREQAILAVASKHGQKHAEDAGAMFDRLWSDMHGAKK